MKRKIKVVRCPVCTKRYGQMVATQRCPHCARAKHAKANPLAARDQLRKKKRKGLGWTSYLGIPTGRRTRKASSKAKGLYHARRSVERASKHVFLPKTGSRNPCGAFGRYPNPVSALAALDAVTGVKYLTERQRAARKRYKAQHGRNPVKLSRAEAVRLGLISAPEKVTPIRRTAAPRTRKATKRHTTQGLFGPARAGRSVGRVVRKVRRSTASFFRGFSLGKRNPAAEAIHAKVHTGKHMAHKFHGRRSTRDVSLRVSKHVPASGNWVAGPIDYVKVRTLRGMQTVHFGSNARLVGNGKRYLAIGNARFKRPGDAIHNPGDVVDAGAVYEVGYRADKPHLTGNSKEVAWYHKFGEESGALPSLLLDSDGYALIEGGKFHVKRTGIHD